MLKVATVGNTEQRRGAEPIHQPQRGAELNRCPGIKEPFFAVTSRTAPRVVRRFSVRRGGAVGVKRREKPTFGVGHLAEHLVEGPPLDELHREVEHAVLGLPEAASAKATREAKSPGRFYLTEIHQLGAELYGPRYAPTSVWSR